jgi:hypothetical protein
VTRMSSGMSTRDLFVRFAVAEPVDGPLGDIADLLAAGTLDRQSFDGVAAGVSERGDVRRFRDGLLDLVLYAARESLRDHALSGDEAALLRELTTLFRVVEGEFSARRREPLARLLRDEMRRLADDGVLDWTEAAYLDAIQAAFRLGYDEFLDLACRDLAIEQRRALGLPGAPPKPALRVGHVDMPHA